MATTMEREPFPDRILDDTGGAFAMGALGGSAYHFPKCLRHSPHGARIAGGMEAMRMDAPHVSGGFAAWGVLFSAFDCTMVFACQKDPWNSIITGATTGGGFLSLCQGDGAVGRSALMGGVALTLIEGTGLMLNRFPAALQELPPLPAADPNLAAAITAEASRRS